jgi:hypothetical protein
MKLRPEEKHSYNSPWNIAASFDVDMSFSAPEIETMLTEYEGDYHTGMDIASVAERLHYYTGGYPFLVSYLCKTIHEKLAKDWSEMGIATAVKGMLYHSRQITLLEDLQKNIEAHADFRELLIQILVKGIPANYNSLSPAIDLGITYGVFVPDNGRVAISNRIFETFIYNYLIATYPDRPIVEEYTAYSQFLDNNRLNLPAVLTRFSAFLRAEYRDRDSAFIEREGRLLFLSFLKPIINGVGNYVVEAETRGSRRMDVIVFYGRDKYIVELKIWRGEQREADAYDQLVRYLKSQEQTEGYLLSFCDNRERPREDRVFVHESCTIHEVIVAYRDRA